MPSYWFDHVHLMSPDPVKTAEFYEKFFKATLVSVMEMPGGRKSVKMGLNGATILIAQAGDSAPEGGLDHFGIRTDDLPAAVTALKAAGVNFTQDIREIRPGFKISFLKAPENVTIELQEGSL